MFESVKLSPSPNRVRGSRRAAGGRPSPSRVRGSRHAAGGRLSPSPAQRTVAAAPPACPLLCCTSYIRSPAPIRVKLFNTRDAAEVTGGLEFYKYTQNKYIYIYLNSYF